MYLARRDVSVVTALYIFNKYFWSVPNNCISTLMSSLGTASNSTTGAVLHSLNLIQIGPVKPVVFPSIALNKWRRGSSLQWKRHTNQCTGLQCYLPATVSHHHDEVIREHLKELISSREKPSPIPEFPCHTQAVERVIKLVTEVSNVVIGKINGEGFIKTRIGRRKRIPTLESKKDYQFSL